MPRDTRKAPRFNKELSILHGNKREKFHSRISLGIGRANDMSPREKSLRALAWNVSSFSGRASLSGAMGRGANAIKRLNRDEVKKFTLHAAPAWIACAAFYGARERA
jgi:hypothetical protein